MKILILASGGDAPGINDYIGQLLKHKDDNIKLFYAKYGLLGVYKNDIHPLNFDPLELFDLPSSIIKCGRFPEFQSDEKIRDKILESCKKFDKVIIMGGNGTKEAAKIFVESGIKTTFIPLTIDNDIDSTELTLGYSTALQTIVTLVNQASYSIRAHGSVLLVEIMGRGCDDLIDNAFILSNSHIKVVDNGFKPSELKDEVIKIHNKYEHCIVLIREKMNSYTFDEYFNELESSTNLCVRKLILGHLQRGGITSINDKILSHDMALKTLESIDDNSVDIIKWKGIVDCKKI